MGIAMAKMGTLVALLFVLSCESVHSAEEAAFSDNYVADETSLLQTKEVVAEDRIEMEGKPSGCCFTYNTLNGGKDPKSLKTEKTKKFHACLNGEIVGHNGRLAWKKGSCPKDAEEAHELYTNE